jgi:hypothetical protein
MNNQERHNVYSCPNIFRREVKGDEMATAHITHEKIAFSEECRLLGYYVVCLL